MGWINFETIRLHCPLFDDKFVGCEAFEGLKASGEIIGIDEVRQVLRELVVAVIVITFNSGFLDGSVHPFNLTVGPWVIDFGQPVLDVMLTANTVENMLEGIDMAFVIGEVDAVIGQYGMYAYGRPAIRLRRNYAAAILPAFSCSST